MSVDAPILASVKNKLALFKDGQKKLIFQNGALLGGDSWIANDMMRRFTGYARKHLGYRGPEYYSKFHILQISKALGWRKEFAAKYCYGWDPWTKDKVPDQLWTWWIRDHQGYQWSQLRSVTGEFKRQKVILRKWCKSKIREAETVRATRDGDNPKKAPFVLTGDMRNNLLARARADTSGSSKSIKLLIRLPYGHAISKTSGKQFRTIPPHELNRIRSIWVGHIKAEVGKSVASPVRRGAKPRMQLLDSQVERFRALVERAKTTQPRM